MDLIVETLVNARWGNRTLTCAIGRAGTAAAGDKREGDGKTPIGRWMMRQVFFRADRMAQPQTSLPLRALNPDEGWCEVPSNADYNKLVRLPHPGVTEEKLWREDHLYDIIVVLGYNDAPIVPGAGSAIFLHLARPDFSPSAGCVTLAQDDVLAVLREADVSSAVVVK